MVVSEEEVVLEGHGLEGEFLLLYHNVLYFIINSKRQMKVIKKVNKLIKKLIFKFKHFLSKMKK